MFAIGISKIKYLELNQKISGFKVRIPNITVLTWPLGELKGTAVLCVFLPPFPNQVQVR